MSFWLKPFLKQWFQASHKGHLCFGLVVKETWHRRQERERDTECYSWSLSLCFNVVSLHLSIKFIFIISVLLLLFGAIQDSNEMTWIKKVLCGNITIELIYLCLKLTPDVLRVASRCCKCQLLYWKKHNNMCSNIAAKCKLPTAMNTFLKLFHMLLLVSNPIKL